MLATSVRPQPGQIARRVTGHRKISLACDKAAVRLIGSRCTVVERGGRMIESIRTDSGSPVVDREFLARTLSGSAGNGARLAVANGDFDDPLE